MCAKTRGIWEKALQGGGEGVGKRRSVRMGYKPLAIGVSDFAEMIETGSYQGFV